MNAKIRRQIARRKRRIAARLDKHDNRGCDRPIMTASNIHYEIAGRTRATAQGGIGAVHLLVRRLELDRAIQLDTLVDTIEDTSPSEIIAALFELEILGVVKQLPGRNFVKVW